MMVEKTKIGFIATGAGLGVRVGLELTNPNPSKDAIEGHTEHMEQQPVEKNKVYGKLLRVGFKIKYFIYEDFYNKSG